ncbi:hypothetical protein RDABS01_039731, partial [Bienertia sinuspersici]
MTTTHVSSWSRKLYYHPRRMIVFSQYSQAQDLFTSRLQDRIQDLPRLVEDIVQTSISTGPRGALRLVQGVQAVVGVGSEWLADSSQNPLALYEWFLLFIQDINAFPLLQWTNTSSAGLPSDLQLGLISPIYLRKLFERLGATYVKLGQFIASAPTLFPPQYVEEFQKCFDRAPPVPFEEIKAILNQELKRPIDSVYEYVDPTPLASASIAQVHAARLKGSQEDVVIKVLKPGIEDVLVADLNFVYVVARIVEFLNPEFSRTSLILKNQCLKKLTSVRRPANIEAFRRYLDTTGLTLEAKAPKVYYHCSTKQVLTMERLYGVPLTDLDSINSMVPSPEISLITALNVWFGSLLACESFHADVHAGNLWLLRDGRIGFLDL